MTKKDRKIKEYVGLIAEALIITLIAVVVFSIVGCSKVEKISIVPCESGISVENMKCEKF